MTSPLSMAAVTVNDLFCDKLTFTIDYKSTADQQHIANNMKEFIDGKGYAKHYPGSQYKHRVFVYAGDYPSKLQMLVEYEPKTSGLNFFRCDFNPAHVDMVGVECFLLMVLPGGIDDIVDKGRVTRLDLSVDLTGIHIDSLLAAYPGMQVTRVFCKSGKMETLYLGGTEGARFVVLYDKVQEVKHQNAKWHVDKPLPFSPTTRIEIRLRPDVTLVQLAAMENPFQKLIIASLASVPEYDELTWRLFVVVARTRGAQDALLMIKDKNQRKTFRDRVKTGIPSWWQVEKLWEKWPAVLHESFMLDGCSKPINA